MAYNFSGLNQNNTLAELLKPYLQSDPAPAVSTPETTYTGSKVYETRNKEEMTYIKPDTTGQKQVIICDADKTIYVARYNYVTGKPDYEEYISKGYIDLYKKNNENSEEMNQIAQALNAVLNELKSMNTELQALKNAPPKVIEKEIIKESETPVRGENGRFKKKGA